MTAMIMSIALQMMMQSTVGLGGFVAGRAMNFSARWVENCPHIFVQSGVYVDGSVILL